MITTILPYVSMNFPVLSSSLRWNYTIFVLLCLAYFEVYYYMNYLTINLKKTKEMYRIFWAKCIQRVFTLKFHTTTLRRGKGACLSCCNNTGLSQKRCSTPFPPHLLPSFSLFSNTSICAPNLTCFLKVFPFCLPTRVASELFCKSWNPSPSLWQ